VVSPGSQPQSSGMGWGTKALIGGGAAAVPLGAAYTAGASGGVEQQPQYYQ
jgi:hypothetical protein